MKRILLLSLLASGSVALSSAVLAQDHHPDGPGHGPQGGYRGGPQDRPGGPGAGRPMSAHGDEHGERRGPEMRADTHGPDRGWPDHPGGPGGWRRGDRIPAEYHDRQYIVDDWRGYRLDRPPRGYHWVGVGGDYLLVAIASGVIASVVTGR
jgi:Ni/Co efflux regulator RcnB